MAKRGPKPTDTETLRKRGSWRARARDKAAAKAKTAKAAVATFAAREVPVSPTDAQLRRVIKLIPGYDPYRDAEGYHFKCALARKAIDFIQQKLTHVKGEKAGQAFVLEPWQQAIVANLFGWVSKTTGLRRYRTAFILVSRKNGKTCLAAAIIDYVLFEDGEPGAEIYGAASKYDQASLVWFHAAGMIHANPDLEARAHVFKGQSKSVEVGQPGDPDYAVYRVISSESLGAHGFSVHAAVVDELHAIQDGDLVDTLETGTGARRQPLIIYITTEDFDRISVCNEKEAYAKAVRDGKLPTPDPTFLPVVYQADAEKDDWKSPKVWAKANPNLGVSVKLEYLKSECRKAIELPRLENTFKRLHLNMKTGQETAWLSTDAWRDCIVPVAVKPADYMNSLLSMPCYVGLDLSSTRDLTAMCVLFPPCDKFEKWRCFWHLYVPQAMIEHRSHADHVPYDVWAAQGHITATPGNAIDYSYVKRDLEAAVASYQIQAIPFDRWGMEALRQQMVSDGLPEELFVAYGQGYQSMSPAMKGLERLILAKQIELVDNPCVMWQAGCLEVETDAAENIKPTKAGGKGRIDGIVALIMAVGEAIVTKPPTEFEEQLVISLA